jgi:hypothetical protein
MTFSCGKVISNLLPFLINYSIQKPHLKSHHSMRVTPPLSSTAPPVQSTQKFCAVAKWEVTEKHSQGSSDLEVKILRHDLSG